MDYALIIRRAWNVTWRNKSLWVLGIFAGASGGGMGGSWGDSWKQDGAKGGSGASAMREFSSSFSNYESYLPVIIAVGVAFFFLGIILAILSIASRGGLVTGVNDVEDGRAPRLGDLWHAGFARFWGIVGLDLLLMLPVVLLVIALTAAILVPLGFGLWSGSEALNAATILPICGVTAIGFPLVLVGAFVLGVMHQIAMRYLMLGGRGCVAAARDAWLFLKARLKDVFLVWLIGVILNAVAGAAFAFVIVLVALPFGLGAGMAGLMSAASSLVGIGVLFVLVAVALGILYSGVLGTFSSAYWTVFFREVQSTVSVVVDPVVIDA